MSYTLAAGNNTGNLTLVIAETVDAKTMLTGALNVDGDEYVFTNRVGSTFTTTALTRDYVAGEIVDVIIDVEHPTTPPSTKEHSLVFFETLQISKVFVSLSNVVVGSAYLIALANGTVLFEGTAATTDLSFPPLEYFGIFYDLVITVRAEGYLPFEVPSTVTNNGSSTFVAQILDNISAPAVVTGWTIDYANRTLSHTSGTDVHTVNEFYSWLQETFIGQLGTPVPMRADTPTIYTLINNWSIPNDADFQFLKGGAIAVLLNGVERDVWANIFSVGTIETGTNFYVIQNSTEVTKFWGANHIDVLVKTKNNYTPIDSGILRVFSRDYGNIFDHFELTALTPARYVIPLSNAVDINNATLEATVAAYTITLQTDDLVGRKIDIDDPAGTYSLGIVANGATVQQLYEFGKFIVAYSSTVTVQGANGKQWVSTNPAYSQIKSSPICTIAGGLVTFARGIFVEGIAFADTLKYTLIDNDGALHTAAPPPAGVTIEANVTLLGAEVRIYDLDDIPAGSFGTELAGVENNPDATFTFTTSAGNLVKIQIMQANYKEYTQQYTVPAESTTLNVRLTRDLVA